MSGVRKGRFKKMFPVRLHFFLCRISAMVEVEMREDDIRHIFAGNTSALKFILQVDQVEEFVIAELFQMFVPCPVVDEYDSPVPVAHQYTAHG